MDPHYHHSQCLECCSSDLCNSQGCGQPGKGLFVSLYCLLFTFTPFERFSILSDECAHIGSVNLFHIIIIVLDTFLNFNHQDSTTTYRVLTNYSLNVML